MGVVDDERFLVSLITMINMLENFPSKKNKAYDAIARLRARAREVNELLGDYSVKESKEQIEKFTLDIGGLREEMKRMTARHAHEKKNYTTAYKMVKEKLEGCEQCLTSVKNSRAADKKASEEEIYRLHTQLEGAKNSFLLAKEELSKNRADRDGELQRYLTTCEAKTKTLLNSERKYAAAEQEMKRLRSNIEDLRAAFQQKDLKLLQASEKLEAAENTIKTTTESVEIERRLAQDARAEFEVVTEAFEINIKTMECELMDLRVELAKERESQVLTFKEQQKKAKAAEKEIKVLRRKIAEQDYSLADAADAAVKAKRKRSEADDDYLVKLMEMEDRFEDLVYEKDVELAKATESFDRALLAKDQEVRQLQTKMKEITEQKDEDIEQSRKALDKLKANIQAQFRAEEEQADRLLFGKSAELKMPENIRESQAHALESRLAQIECLRSEVKDKDNEIERLEQKLEIAHETAQNTCCKTCNSKEQDLTNEVHMLRAQLGHSQVQVKCLRESVAEYQKISEEARRRGSRGEKGEISAFQSAVLDAAAERLLFANRPETQTCRTSASQSSSSDSNISHSS